MVQKLTDSQLVILSAAASRNNGAVLPMPKTMRLNKGAVTIVLNSLLAKELIEERSAQLQQEAWREDDEGSKTTLFLTNAGRRAIGVDDSGPAETEDGAVSPKVGKSKKKPSPRSTAKRTAAAGPSKKQPPDGNPAVGRKVKPPVPTSGSTTKQDVLLALLKRKSGATIDDLMTATGWQAHSVRGAISGLVRKKLGLDVTSTLEAGSRVYRVAGRV